MNLNILFKYTVIKTVVHGHNYFLGKKIKRILTAFKTFCQEIGGINKCNCFLVSSAMLLETCDEGMRPFQCQFKRDPLVALSHLDLLWHPCC